MSWRRSQQIRTWQPDCNAGLPIAITTHMHIAQITNQTYLFIAWICHSVGPTTVASTGASAPALMSADACNTTVCPCVQVNVDANVARQSELLVVINKNTAAYRQAFGFREWRQACEVCF